ncbi:monooxygenase [Chloropicon primus]|uniref:Monooxygenase n=1 Tax=Chloropicon primus TaxID=1764295 RepID=A0A5B8MPR6_9CHLO|nr:monooxygenase [Chloropicon primus]|mmetsp:Transcript_4389/g.12920  ORF Transcript_4389/g.12920 Transcript_4389/m.12920 type:complete len:412 (+) Transcript_4389:37-1272(+)|eukprot:QDZ22044.1 monooxygenase [Chloropicon primus]
MTAAVLTTPRGGGRGPRVRAHAASGVDRSLSDRVVVVGGGIAGLACAVALKRARFPVTVLESAKGKREGGTAIALWTNAWRALESLGVADELRAGHQELNQIQLCAAKQKVLKSFSLDECDGGPHEFRGVYRRELLSALESKLDGTDIMYGVEVKEATTSGQGVLLQTSQGQALECRAVVGCDGIGSRVADSLGLPKPNFSGYSAIRGVATFPSDLKPISNTVRQIMGSGMRAGMYPLSRSEVYWFVCFNSDSDWAKTCRKDDVLEKLKLFNDWDHALSETIAATDVESVSVGSISDRWRWGGVGVGNLTVAGDALHPMTPNLGQGGCCALEDAVVLSNCLARGQGTMEEALREYERERLKRCFPLTVRANIMGALLQIGNPIVTGVRDAVIERVFSPAHFLDHTCFDCRL